MSRTPIREALKMLMRDDLVEIRDAWHLRQICHPEGHRGCLRGAPGPGGAGRPDRHWRFLLRGAGRLEARFRSLQVRLEQGETVRVEEFADADWALHDQILQKSGNRYAQKATNDLRAVLRRYQYLSVRLLSRVEESLTEHLAILDCIRRRDLARLTELLENHIQY